MAGGDLWFFDRIAPLYDAFMFPADADALSAALALADREIASVLDVAGGTGRAIETIEANERIVLDASRPMLERIADPAVHRLLGDAHRIPVATGSMDAVVITDALHHLPDPDRAIREMDRVLAPGGVVIIRGFDPESVRGRAIELLEALVQFGSRFYSPSALQAKLEARGLMVSIPAAGWTYTVAGVKPPE
jgi:demethylmenaquinone methyltransferase/2-methoxy-6-polyprenyl-1,4-benzoquinol methylase